MSDQLRKYEGQAAVVSQACTRKDHGHCVYWVCAQRCACSCHRPCFSTQSEEKQR
jgi:hypothetical protein